MENQENENPLLSLPNIAWAPPPPPLFSLSSYPLYLPRPTFSFFLSLYVYPPKRAIGYEMEPSPGIHTYLRIWSRLPNWPEILAFPQPWKFNYSLLFSTAALPKATSTSYCGSFLNHSCFLMYSIPLYCCNYTTPFLQQVIG